MATNSSPSNRGKVKFFNDSKGFGFIIDDHDKTEYFVHATNIKGGGRLTEGDAVYFTVAQGKKGPIADSVTKVS